MRRELKASDECANGARGQTNLMRRELKEPMASIEAPRRKEHESHEERIESIFAGLMKTISPLWANLMRRELKVSPPTANGRR